MQKLLSTQNPFIKSLVLLKEKAKYRRNTGTFLIEGMKEVTLAYNAGYSIDKILFYPKICSNNELTKWSENVELIEISKEIFRKLAYRNTSDGIIAVVKCKPLDLSLLKLSKNPLILVIEALEKPGNVGAILRTADAAKIDAVIIANPVSDLYNPNTVRSSLGCLFTNQIAIGNTCEIINFLKMNSISVFCATLQNSNSYNTQDYTKASAIVIGSESKGLSNEWRESYAKNIIIPMAGKIDSMNVSVSAAVLIFEAIRQRGF
jgi:TrmH family RNA methyltransferase